jgi:putative ABC transport system permease protein
MKWLPLVWAGLRRTPSRSIFTLLSIIVAFLLIGVVSGVNASFQHALDSARADRVRVFARFGGWLPAADAEQIGRIPGVRHVGYFSVLPGFYRDAKTGGLGVMMADDKLSAVQPEIPITAEQLKALGRMPTGLIANTVAAQRFQLKPGDVFPVQSTIPQRDGSTLWTFKVLAIIPPTAERAGDPLLLGNYAYLDQGRADMLQGQTTLIQAFVDDPRRAGDTSAAIERRFENSSTAVTAVPEQAAVANGLQGFINARFMSYALTAAALFMILFLTTNVMAESVNERVPEFAAMKALGMSDHRVAAIVFAEAAIPFIFGAGMGLALSKATPTISQKVFGPIGIFTPLITAEVIASSVMLAVLAAVVASIPAVRRVVVLSVADALAVR